MEPKLGPTSLEEQLRATAAEEAEAEAGRVAKERALTRRVGRVVGVLVMVTVPLMVGYVVVTTLSSATFSSWLCLGALALAFVIALVRGAIRWVLRAAMDGGTRP